MFQSLRRFSANRNMKIKGGGLGQTASAVVPKKLYVGNRLDGLAAKVSNTKHFTHILCLEEAAKYPDPESKLEFMSYPLSDGGKSDLEALWEDVKDFVMEAAQNGKLLVHCTSGSNRAPSFAILFLIKVHGLSYEAAYRRVVSVRDGVRIHENYQEQLKKIAGSLSQIPRQPETKVVHVPLK